MSLITPAQAQALGIGVELATADLQAIIDREEAELTRRFGLPQAAAITETVRPRGASVYLRRPVATVTSVADALYVGDPAPAPRLPADYAVWGDEGRLERAATAAGWGAVVVVTYTPPDESHLRTSVLIELVRIAAEQRAGAAGSETIKDGEASVTFQHGGATDYRAARDAQYARLGWLS